MYKYYNANKKGNFVNDCVIRAISVAQNKSWEETFTELSAIANYEGTMIDDVDFVEKYLNRRYPRKCYKNTTLSEFIENNPYFIHLVTMNGHITVVIDGVVYDTFDCRDRFIRCSWLVKKT